MKRQHPSNQQRHQRQVPNKKLNRKILGCACTFMAIGLLLQVTRYYGIGGYMVVGALLYLIAYVVAKSRVGSDVVLRF